MNAQEPQQHNASRDRFPDDPSKDPSDFENEVEDLVEESIDHEYAVYVRLHEDGGWPEGALAGLVADLHASRPRVERVDAPAHDVVLSVDGDGLDAQGAARRAVGHVAAAASARGLSGHAADVTVLSDDAVWTYDAEQIATW